MESWSCFLILEKGSSLDEFGGVFEDILSNSGYCNRPEHLEAVIAPTFQGSSQGVDDLATLTRTLNFI